MTANEAPNIARTLTYVQEQIARIRTRLESQVDHGQAISTAINAVAAEIAVLRHGQPRRQAITALLAHMHTYYSGFAGMDPGEVTALQLRARASLERDADLGILADVSSALQLADETAVMLLARSSGLSPLYVDTPSELLKRIHFEEAFQDLKAGTFAILRDCQLILEDGANPDLIGTVVAGYSLCRSAANAR